MARPWAIVLHIYVMLVCIEGCQLICTLNRIFYSRMTSENAKPVNFRNSTRIAQWRSCRCAVLWRSSITCRFVQSTTSERLSQISRRNAELLKCRMHSPRTAPSSGTLHVHSTCIIRRPTSDNFSPSQLTLQRHHNHNLRTTFLTNIMWMWMWFICSQQSLSTIKQHAQSMSWTARQQCCTYNCPLTNYKRKRIKPTPPLAI